jgi:hypothetical protein
MARLYQAFFNNNMTVLMFFEVGLGMQSTVLQSVVKTMRYHTQSWIFGGALANYTAQDLLFGFETSVPDMIDGGEFFAGNDYRLVR